MTTFEFKVLWISMTNWGKSKRDKKLELCGFNCAFNDAYKEHCFVFLKRTWDEHKCYLGPVIALLLH